MGLLSNFQPQAQTSTSASANNAIGSSIATSYANYIPQLYSGPSYINPAQLQGYGYRSSQRGVLGAGLSQAQYQNAKDSRKFIMDYESQQQANKMALLQTLMGGIGSMGSTNYNNIYQPALTAGVNDFNQAIGRSDAATTGSLSQLDAANKAAQAQLKPYLDTGEATLSGITQLLGGNPGQAEQYIKNTPGYQFRYNSGLDAAKSTLAGKAAMNSGKAIKALTQYGQDFATAEYDNSLNRMYSLLGITSPMTETAANMWQQLGLNQSNVTQEGANRSTGLLQNLAGFRGDLAKSQATNTSSIDQARLQALANLGSQLAGG